MSRGTWVVVRKDRISASKHLDALVRAVSKVANKLVVSKVAVNTVVNRVVVNSVASRVRETWKTTRSSAPVARVALVVTVAQARPVDRIAAARIAN